MNNIDRMARLRAAQNSKVAKSTFTSGKGDGVTFPFWNIGVGETALVRFLPDANEDNPFGFIREKFTIKVPFAGQVGGDYPTDEEVIVTITSPKTWGEVDPIEVAIKPLWKADEADRKIASTYYRRSSSIASALIVKSPLTETPVPVSPIRRLVLNSSLAGIIMASLMDEERIVIPCDYDEGCDFKISKTQKGEWADYTTSSFSLRNRALNDVEKAAITQFGLVDLDSVLGPKLIPEAVDMLVPMYEASRRGDPFDYVSFGKHFRAYPANFNGTRTAPTGSATSAPVATPARTAKTQITADAVLSKIQNRVSA